MAAGRLTALWHLPTQELEKRYAAGAAPDPTAYVGGTLDGALLQLMRWEGRNPVLRGLWRTLVGSGLLLWNGKRFWRTDEDDVEATNLVGPRVFGRTALRMDIRREPSTLPTAADKEILAVRYDRPDNPKLVHNVRDELVEIEPGLMLGKMVRLSDGGDGRAVLWFGLERRNGATAVG